MQTFLSLFFSSLLFLFSAQLSAQEDLQTQLPKLKVTVIAWGTVNWELQHIKQRQLDHKNGYDLVIDRVASLSAARIAITADNTDFIVSDWLWASERNHKGANLRFIPFSKQVGSIIASPGNSISSYASLKGKRIGVAGGPMNKGWALMRAAANKEGIDLKNEAKIQFGAPPLLTQAIKNGQIDILATFWHYGARLEAEGYKKLYSLKTIMRDLGLKSNVPMLGYLYKAKLGDQHPHLVAAFYKSINEAKAQLAVDDTAWQALRPFMKSENNKIYHALITGYRSGIPDEFSQQHIEDAANFYTIIDDLKPYPTGLQLNPELFHNALFDKGSR
ncbi:ABC transporter substrate-binding protein [Neptunomonas japonica]|uniref:NitT/TauT family transport system substrate-binding protein n=1 Tax=Neptunomonas japonica JAMM 1380 TaxID=1441457 RepID=A0A7R6PIY1_9GAMM|nr:ABC transporter substrate-binding protein [Neptunomonas japonica]BBB30443.1 NitT/TauT family transport system substrate-binding protein [Neptunomonas japonica JAMM 1380]